MARQTNAPPPPAPTNDFFAKQITDREGVHPSVTLVFARVGNADGVNAFGLPTYPHVLGDALTYFQLHINSSREKGRDLMVALMGRVAQKMAAGESLDGAQANVAYELLDECDAFTHAWEILEELGIEVQGSHPYSNEPRPAPIPPIEQPEGEMDVVLVPDT